MKGKKFYVLLIGLILIGLGSIFLYRQQEEQRVLEFEGYEISAIESRVDALYNAEKTDIARDISEEELEALETIFEDLDEKKLSRRSRDQIRDMQLDFLMVREMLETEEDVQAVFVEGNVVDKDVSEEDIDELDYAVLTFETKQDYVDRNIERLAYARQQVVTIDRATEFVENLFDEEENVLATVSREDEEEAWELIENIQNEEVKEELTARVEMVGLALTEREEQLALEEEIQAAEELEEDIEVEIEEPVVYEEFEEVEETEEVLEEPQYTAPPAQPETSRPPASSGVGGSTGGSPSGGTANGTNSGGSGGSVDAGETNNTGTPPVAEESETEESNTPEEPLESENPEEDENDSDDTETDEDPENGNGDGSSGNGIEIEDEETEE